jgi:hypothetical protein
MSVGLALEEAVAASTRAPMSVVKVQNIGTRAVLALIAVGMFAAGLTQLTSMLAIPFVIALWLGAAALFGIVVFASLDGHPPPYADSCEYAAGSHPNAGRRH